MKSMSFQGKKSISVTWLFMSDGLARIDTSRSHGDIKVQDPTAATYVGNRHCIRSHRSSSSIDQIHALQVPRTSTDPAKVAEACECIQYFGIRKDETGPTCDLGDRKCLDRAKQAFEEAMSEFNTMSRLRRFYDEEA